MNRRRLLPLLVFALLSVAPGAASASSLGQAGVSSSQRDSSQLDFGGVPTGTTRSSAVTVSNTGSLPVGGSITIDRISVSDRTGSVALNGGSCKTGSQLASGRSCTIGITFSPRSERGTSTTLIVAASNSAGGDASAPPFPVKGHGISSCDDSVYSGSRDSSNPLVLPPAVHTAGAENPLQGAEFFVDHRKGLAVPYLGQHPSLRKIANQPENKRFSRYTAGGSPAGVQGNVRNFLCRVHDEGPGTIPTASIYRIHHDKCGHAGDSGGEQAAYRSWINGLAMGIGRQPMVLFYEFDALITAGCLSHNGLNARIGELKYGLNKLRSLPHTVIYIDAGAADALTYRATAKLLNRVGIGGIAGFFLNSTHFDWTSSEVAYGRRVSKLVGGKHFVVSTSVNGRGPLRPRNRVKGGNEVLCNPTGRGLGIRPTTNTHQSGVDGFLWIGNAGLSGGKGKKCNYGPDNGSFFLKYALSLVAHANSQYGPQTKSLPY